MTDQPARPRKKLTPKQELFIIEYAKDFNATQAAIRAGYAPKYANREGSRLVDKCRQLIEERRQQALQVAANVPSVSQALQNIDPIASLEQSLKMVTALAFYDHRKLYEGGQIKAPDQLTRRQALMVADFQVEENFVKVGEQAEHVGYTKKVRLVDRAPYLNMLLKWHRAFPSGKTEPAKESPRPAFNTQGWSEEDWQAFKRLYQKSQQPPVDVTHGRS